MFYFAMKQPDEGIRDVLTVTGNFSTMPFFRNNQVYTSSDQIVAEYKTESYGTVGTIGQYNDGAKRYSMQVATDGKVPPFATCYPSKIFGSQNEISSDNVVPIPTRKIKGTWYIDIDAAAAPFFPAFCGCELSGKFKNKDGVETAFTYISGVPHYGTDNHYIVKAENDELLNEMYPNAMFGKDIILAPCSVSLLKNVGNVHSEDDFVNESIQMTGWLNYELLYSVRRGYLIFDTEQEIPEPIYNWIESISTKLTENIVEIKNADGSVKRGEIKTTYQNIGMRIQYSGGIATAKIETIAPGIVGTLTWTPSQAGSGIQFLGLSYNKNAKIADIKIGTGYYPLSSGTDLVLYEVWARPEPVPSGTVTMALYKSSAEENKVDKTADIKLWSTPFIQGTLNQSCDMINPTINMELTSYPDFNYVQIPQFGNRYYFVTGITSVQKNIWAVSLKCDVLMSYRQNIKALNGEIARNEFIFNEALFDDRLKLNSHVEERRVSQRGGSPFNVKNPGEVFVALTVSTKPFDPFNTDAPITPDNVSKPADKIPLSSCNTTYLLNWENYKKVIDAIVGGLNVGTMFSNASESIISVVVLPFNPTTVGGGWTTAVDSVLIGNGIVTGVQARILKGNPDPIIVGSVNVPKSATGNEYLDDTGVTASIYLPFYGFRDLNYSTMKESKIKAKYVVNYKDGTAMIVLTRERGGYEIDTPIDIINTTVGVSIPINGTNYNKMVLEAGIAALSSAASASTGLAPLAAAGISEIGNIAKAPQIKGEYSGAYGMFYMPTEMELILRYKTYSRLADSSYAHTFGRPLYMTMPLSSLSGTTVVSEIHMEGFESATKSEIDEIEMLLKSGVIL